MRLAAVACTSSSLTPSDWATIFARSTSKPSSSRLALIELNGGTSAKTMTRTVPRSRISDSLSARASPAPMKLAANMQATASIPLKIVRIVLVLRLASVQDRAEEGLELRRARPAQHLGGRTLFVDPPLVHEQRARGEAPGEARSEEHTSELQSLMRNSYAVFCLKKTTTTLV